ncbi:MAG: hypothetical protein OXG35_29955 [Acidobacteria bacterium]|nr:hypothetical protein [Acidobacteriota bacterium]
MATVGSRAAATGKLKMAGDELTIMVRDVQAAAVYALMADPVAALPEALGLGDAGQRRGQQLAVEGLELVL